MALVNAAVLRSQLRDAETVRELAQALSALAEEHGFVQLGSVGRFYCGWAMVQRGEVERGIAELEAGAALLPGRQYVINSQVPQAYLRAGLADRAIAAANEILAENDGSRSLIADPELYRIKGDAILMRDASATLEAESCYRKAIEIAKGQSAKWWELRVTVSLARLLDRTGHRDEARAMLAEIYNWFTEGFDTADLNDAKAQLDEMGG